MNLRFFFDSSPQYGPDSVALFVQARARGQLGFAKPIEIELKPEGEHDPRFIPQPSAMLTRADVQGMVDELWRAGWRPRNVESAAGELEATKRHLEDMRRLVAKSTDCPLDKP